MQIFYEGVPRHPRAPARPLCKFKGEPKSTSVHWSLNLQGGFVYIILLYIVALYKIVPFKGTKLVL